MLKHIVFFQLDPKLNEQQKQQLYASFSNLLQDCAQIPGVIKIESGFKQPGLDCDFDLAIYSEMQDQDSLNLYQDHPLHVKVKQLLAGKVVKRSCMDYLV